MSAKAKLISEKQAYDFIRQKAQEYVDRSVNRKGARSVAARLATALALAGLPMTTANYFEPVQRGDLIIVHVKRPRSYVHEYVVTPEEVRTIKNLIKEAKQFYTSERSLERVLQDEAKRFLEYAGIENITTLDIYAIKLRILGLGQLLKGRYPLRRLELVLSYISQAVEKRPS
jgi:spore cortex formation protein SpoVR/YcgB (stage V sporulation)